MGNTPFMDFFKRSLHFWHTLFVWLYIGVVTVIMGSLAMFFGLIRLEHISHHVGRLWGWLIKVILMIDIQVENRERIPHDRPVIVIANHQSMIDIIVFFVVLDIQFRWMAKAGLFKIPIFGWGMAGAGYIPVERDDRKKAMVSLFNAAAKIKSGRSVIVFPEGTRSTDPEGKMLPFKKGAFILAKKAEVTLLPITIWGAGRIAPKSEKHWIQRVYPGVCRVVIHEPVAPEVYADMSLDKLSDHLESIIAAPMERLRSEINLSGPRLSWRSLPRWPRK